MGAGSGRAFLRAASRRAGRPNRADDRLEWWRHDDSWGRSLHPKQEGAGEMADEIVDLGKVRESKAKEFDGYCQHMDGIRQQILRLAIKDMRKFSSKEEIAKTLRFAVDVLEGRDG
jgi:hypothetical protein